MKNTLRCFAASAAVALTLLTASSVQAGPFILAGTDADDHGSFSAGANQNGWFFMQRAIENLAPGVTNGNQHVVFLGSDPGSEAGNAALSAFTNSALPGMGWTSEFINGAAVDAFLSGGLVGAGIVMMDSGGNVSGGATATERGYFTSNAANIDSFLGAGGGLFSQANGYGWVNALLPTLSVDNISGSGLFLTPAGNAAFPGLTNADLSSGPFHNTFSNTGTLPILAVDSSQRAVILGASGGSVTNPGGGVPDSGSLIAMYLAVAGLMFRFRRHMVLRSA